MKYLKLLNAIILCFFCYSCGHNITHTDRGTGLVARIPLPDGSSLIDLKIGKIDSTTTVLRGGSTYDSAASTGGSLFGTMGTSDRIQVSTIPQLNESNLKEVLNDKNTPKEVKIALIQYLIKQKAPKSLPATTKSIGAATRADLNNPIAEPETTRT